MYDSLRKVPIVGYSRLVTLFMVVVLSFPSRFISQVFKVDQIANYKFNEFVYF